MKLWFTNYLRANGRVVPKHYSIVQHQYQWRIQDFSEVGTPTLGGRGAPTYDFAKFSEKLHEIERIWTLGEGTHPSRPLDPPLNIIVYHTKYFPPQ